MYDPILYVLLGYTLAWVTILLAHTEKAGKIISQAKQNIKYRMPDSSGVQEPNERRGAI